MKGQGHISIKHIGLAFVTGLLVLVSLIGGFSAYQTRALTHNLAQHNQNAARSELAAAVQRLLSQTEDLAIQLAEWDETRQQLVVPEYYPYWRDQRVYESGILSSRLLRVALYTEAGTLIEPSPNYRQMPSSLPAGMPAYQTFTWISKETGTIALYHAFPVFGDAQRQALLGHGVLRVDFMPALLRPDALHFIDATSVSVALKPGELLSAADLLSRLNFSARTDPDQLHFQTILSRTLLSLFVLLISAALIGFLVYTRLLIRPLGRLSQDIDAMQHGRFKPGPSHAHTMRISELESIRSTL
jgi:hypothetical protein